MTKCNLIVTDAGDPSVGIWAQSWAVECPFSEEDARGDFEMANAFLNDMVKTYQEYCDGRCSGDFLFVLKESIDKLD